MSRGHDGWRGVTLLASALLLAGCRCGGEESREIPASLQATGGEGERVLVRVDGVEWPAVVVHREGQRIRVRLEGFEPVREMDVDTMTTPRIAGEPGVAQGKDVSEVCARAIACCRRVNRARGQGGEACHTLRTRPACVLGLALSQRAGEAVEVKCE